jgi:xanthine dehydrogenase YagS FAD-binding subunit
MRAFEYASATRLSDAVDGDGSVRFLAGGTDLLPLMKLDVVQPTRLVDLKHVAELEPGIRESDGGIAIGALTTLAELESSALLRSRYAAAAEAAALAATPQLRNMATLGGNLLQRPRCWYFRSSQFQCWLKGGEVCHARDGENQLHAIMGDSPCVAVHPSDPPAALVALGAEVSVWDSGSTRRIPLAEFFALPREDRRTENLLRPGEVVTSVWLPPATGVRSTYRKAMNRKVWAFVLVGVAAAVRFDGGAVRDARLVLNGVAPIPWRAASAERVLEGSSLDDAATGRAAEAAVAEAQPLALNGYKVALVRGLVQQALRGLREAASRT